MLRNKNNKQVKIQSEVQNLFVAVKVTVRHCTGCPRVIFQRKKHNAQFLNYVINLKGT